MSYIKKNINFSLLALIIVLAIAIASLGIYYNENYNSLSGEYTRQVESLQQVTDDLLFHKTRLNQTSRDLQIKEQDESALNERYTELRDDNEQLDSDNKVLRQELQQRTQELTSKTNELIQAQTQIAQKNIEIADLKDDVDLYRTRANNLEDKVDDICAGQTNLCS